jgi:hypothetical protein
VTSAASISWACIAPKLSEEVTLLPEKDTLLPFVSPHFTDTDILVSTGSQQTSEPTSVENLCTTILRTAKAKNLTHSLWQARCPVDDVRSCKRADVLPHCSLQRSADLLGRLHPAQIGRNERWTRLEDVCSFKGEAKWVRSGNLLCRDWTKRELSSACFARHMLFRDRQRRWNSQGKKLENRKRNDPSIIEQLRGFSNKKFRNEPNQRKPDCTVNLRLSGQDERLVWRFHGPPYEKINREPCFY